MATALKVKKPVSIDLIGDTTEFQVKETSGGVPDSLVDPVGHRVNTALLCVT
jgi:hypothetical protein